MPKRHRACLLQHRLDSLDAADIRNFVRVLRDQRRSARDHRARKFDGRDERPLDMDMRVHEARRDISPFQIDRSPGRPASLPARRDGGDAVALDRDVDGLNFPREDVEQARIQKNQVGRAQSAPNPNQLRSEARVHFLPTIISFDNKAFFSTL